MLSDRNHFPRMNEFPQVQRTAAHTTPHPRGGVASSVPWSDTATSDIAGSGPSARLSS